MKDVLRGKTSFITLAHTETKLSLSSSSSNEDYHYKLRVNIFHEAGYFIIRFFDMQKMHSLFAFFSASPYMKLFSTKH